MLFIRDALLVGLVTLGATYAVYRTGKYIYVKQKVRTFLLGVKKYFSSLTFEDITRRLTKVGRLRKENEAALAASIARIERNLEDKVDNMFKHHVTAYIVLDIVFRRHA